ncbi:MAG: type II CAAX endopeptidase family protein [Coriobacteriia bacterium]|nr:type II CAAX endopeptidase family protein [Coriobacteriia bacterium]
MVAERQRKAAQRSEELAAADERDGRVSWTLPEAGLVLAVMMASLLATDAIIGSSVMESVPAASRAVVRSAILAVFYGIQLLTLGFLAARRNVGLRAAFGLQQRRVGLSAGLVTAGLVTLVLLVTRAVATSWGWAARAAGWTPPDVGDLMTVFGGGGAGFALAAITVVVLGPLAEELAFRGVVLRAAGARWGQWPATVGTAALFAAYHMTAWTAVPLFALGIALGWLAWTRRSLWAAILVHALYNGTVVAAAYWLAA